MFCIACEPSFIFLRHFSHRYESLLIRIILVCPDRSCDVSMYRESIYKLKGVSQLKSCELLDQVKEASL